MSLAAGVNVDGDLTGVTVVFDLDGTIANTAPDLIDAANAALLAHGFDRAEAKAIKTGVGYGTKAMLRAALVSMGREADDSLMQAMADELVRHYEANICKKTYLFAGFTGARRTLRDAGAKLALCTNKNEVLALKLLDELRLLHVFDAIAGRDTFAFHKPDPRHITEVIRLAGGDPARAVMVGDSETDVAAAQAAGIPVVAVRFGYASVPVEDLGATAIIDHFRELPSVVQRLAASFDRVPC